MTCHSNIFYECSECPKKFTNKAYLQKHIKSHNQQKSYVCDICFTAFTRSYTMAKHKKVKHEGEKKFSCDICQMR